MGIHRGQEVGRAHPPRTRAGRIFLSPGERRLRTGWRLLAYLGIQLLVFAAVAPLAGLILAPLALSLDSSFLPGSLLQIVAITLAVFLARLYVDRRTIRSLGQSLDHRAPCDLLVGFALGGLLMGLIFGVEWAAGWLRVEGFAPEGGALAPAIADTLAVLLVIGIVPGWTEELFTRGYLLRNLADGAGVRWGVIGSSALFGLLHAGNPNATWYSTLSIVVAGFLLAYGWVRTGQLWLSIGLHAGWNYFQGGVFGFPVSGLEIGGLIEQAATGPEVITGGPFGPEGGLISLPAMLLGILMIRLYARRRPLRHGPAPGEPVEARG